METNPCCVSKAPAVGSLLDVAQPLHEMPVVPELKRMNGCRMGRGDMHIPIQLEKTRLTLQSILMSATCTPSMATGAAFRATRLRLMVS